MAGDGVYTGIFAATTLTGFYGIVVSAEGSTPAFTRQQQLEVMAAPSAARFSGTLSDHGVDADGDGRFDQLAVDIGVDIDAAAAYRIVGTLTDGAGTAIEQVRGEQQLQPGPQTMSLAFDGARLFALGHDGPYLLDDLVFEDVATQTGLAVGPAYTTAAYAHTDFQRPPLLLTGNTSDHGAHTVHMERLPYEELVVQVEVDTSIAVEVEAIANLHAEDGSFIVAGCTFSSLPAGPVILEFQLSAHSIFRAGKPGPFTFTFPTLVSGNPYEVWVKPNQPARPRCAPSTTPAAPSKTPTSPTSKSSARDPADPSRPERPDCGSNGHQAPLTPSLMAWRASSAPMQVGQRT